jgi:hypothetical protein
VGGDEASVAAGEDAEGLVDSALLRLLVAAPFSERGPTLRLLAGRFFVLFEDLFHLFSGRIFLNL